MLKGRYAVIRSVGTGTARGTDVVYVTLAGRDLGVNGVVVE